MRRIVSMLLVVLTGAFVAVVWLQHESTPAPAATTKPLAATPTSTPTAPAPAKPTPPPLHRTLRTVALGWEWLAPGVVASDGAFKTAGVDASFANAASMDDVAAALARGGAEVGGADIAIVPLSSYVAAYERLRALAPEIVLVVGWSHGREALFGADASALVKLPANGAVKLAAAAGQPETLHALYVLDLAGVAASRVELVDKAPLVAVFRGAKQKPPGKLLLTSADTPRLVPIVAVVPHGFVHAHEAELEAWAKVWLAGVARLAGDVPAGARQVATIPGAPPVLAIIEALGQVEFASLRENATAIGLSGRGALTLDAIFKTTWRIWRDAGAIATPPPELVPVSTDVVAALVRTEPGAIVEPTRAPAHVDAGKRPDVLLVVRVAPGKDGKLDHDAIVNAIGVVAGVFDRLPIRVDVRDDAKTAELLAGMARDRFGLRPAQLAAGKKPPAGASAAIEVLSAM